MTVPFTAVQLAVANFYGVTIETLFDDSRKKPISTYRQVAMVVARRACCLSTTKVGRLFNERDHSTVVHAERVVDRTPELKDAALTIIAKLRGTHDDGWIKAVPFKHRPLPPAHVHRPRTLSQTPKHRLKNLQAQNDGMGRAAPITLPKFPWEP